MKKDTGYNHLISFDITGTPGPIRTGGLRIRSPALYPAELRAHKDGVSDGT
jgi:hypothetical protein